MSDGQLYKNRPKQNTSWLHSEPSRRARRPSSVSPVRVIEEAVSDIRESVRRNLETRYSSESSPEHELHPNVVIEREFSFDNVDINITTDNNRRDENGPHPTYARSESIESRISHRGEFSLTSYDSSVFNPEEFYLEQRTDMATQPPNTPREGTSGERPVTSADIDAEINRLRMTTTHSHRGQEQIRTCQDTRDSVLDQILEGIRGLQDRVSRLEVTNYDYYARPVRRENNHALLNLTYGRTTEDVRNQHDPINSYIKLKEARDMIPEIDGTSRNQIQKFLNASTYAMSEINPAEEKSLLKAILCTKLTGKAMHDFQTRDIRSFAQLKQEIEMCYLAKRSTTHIQREFNMLQQKHGENAREYGLRVDKLAMELYQSMVEGREQTNEQRKAILDTIQELALENFQLGLREEIQTIVRSRNYSNLAAAILGATAEEKLKGPSSRTSYTNKNKEQDQSRQGRHPAVQCQKCGKLGHLGRDCRTSRYANRFTLPKAEKTANVNNVDKYCTYCKRTGHKRDECWSLNGRPEKEQLRRSKRDIGKGKHVNTTVKVRKSKLPMRSEESFSSSSDEEEKPKTKATRAAREHQVTQVTDSGTGAGLHFITLPIQETKKGKMSFLLDTGATLTLIKVGHLKGDTLIREKQLALTGVTGHKIYTLGKIRATVTLGKREIRHTMHVVKDDFPIDYEGILGIDFLTKQRAKCDHGRRQVRIGDETFKLHPFKKMTLTPHSETIVQAVANRNRIGIVSSEETKPGIFIGSCLVEPKDYTCPISIINTTKESVEITTPLVTVDEIRVSDRASILALQHAEYENYESIEERKDNLRKQLRLGHLNREEKRAVEEICEDFCDIFHLEKDILTCTTAIAHEIKTRVDSAPVNVRPYRLPEKHKEEVNRQITNMLNDEIIRPSMSQWNAPLLVVPKKTDASGKPKLRVVVDFRKLNDLTIGDSFPLPNITDILDQLGNAKYFSTLDLASGYHQIPMHEEHKNKTAFSTPYGHFEFNRMPFGLKNAPATFQRLMNSVLTGIQGLKCLVYLDDIVIYGPNLKEHNKRLIQVMDRLRKHNLKLQPDKCEFLRKEVTYLGHIITEDGIRPDPNKLCAVENFPVPKKVKDVQSFLGLAGYYRKFIEDFSKIAKPLTKLTKKGEKFNWTAEQQIAFQSLKEKLTTAPVLSYPDFTREFLVTTDASDYAIGAVLSQGPVGQDRPIAYASRILCKAEQNYNTTEKELLAIVWAVKYFRPYLYGTRFKIVTDHRPLIWLFNISDPGSRLIRWRLKLEEYDYEIVHKAGKGNTNADALSRNPIPDDQHINSVGQKKEEEEAPKEYSEEEKRQILYEYHDAPTGGHQGIARTLSRIRLKHNWHGITRDIEEYVGKCEYCQKNKLSRKTKMPLIITDTPTRPFEKCALDIVGPLTVTTNGNKYVLTFQNNLTKLSKAIPLANQEAATVAKEFVTKIVFEHGIPEKILTDQGTNFTSEMFKNTCKLLRIEKIQTSAYHPESNGALERSHRTLAEYLRHYINNDQTDWDEWLPYAMFTYNTTPHSATGFTPFELTYGHQAILPSALARPPKPTYSYDDYAQELRERLRATNQLAKDHLQEEKFKAKLQYDKGVNKKIFKIGDKVLLLDETVRRGRSKKLESQWVGPYTIIAKFSDVNYEIKRARKTIRVHANRLKLFIEI